MLRTKAHTSNLRKKKSHKFTIVSTAVSVSDLKANKSNTQVSSSGSASLLMCANLFLHRLALTIYDHNLSAENSKRPSNL